MDTGALSVRKPPLVRGRDQHEDEDEGKLIGVDMDVVIIGITLE